MAEPQTEEKKQRKKHFKPDEHLVNKGGKKFITYVGLQAQLIDQGKFVKSTKIETLSWPWENPYKLYICKVTMVISNKEGIEATYEGTGDAGINSEKDGEGFELAIDNVGGMVKPHFIRMGETRAHVRCLRQATRSEYTASEEL